MGTIHNELRTAGRFAVGILDALGVEEADAGIERFSETLQPILDVWRRPDWALLRGERIWSVAPSQIAVAAEFSQVGIRNPAGSNRITVVEGFLVWTTLAGQLEAWDVTTNAAAAVSATGAVSSRDTRMPNQTGLTTLGIATHQGAALGGRIMTVSPQTNLYNYFPGPPVVLSPGFDLLFGPAVVNKEACATFWGYERPAFKRELQIRS